MGASSRCNKGSLKRHCVEEVNKFQPKMEVEKVEVHCKTLGGNKDA